MVKIIVNTELKEESEIKVQGKTMDVIHELGFALYSILKQLHFKEEKMTDRIDFMTGAMLFHLVNNEGVDALKKE